MIKVFLTTTTLFCVTGACIAQAPVVDLNDAKTPPPQELEQTVIAPALGIEARLAVLERKDVARTQSQQRIQRQLDLLQGEVDEIRGTIELHNHQLDKILQRQRDLYLELDNRFAALQQQTQSVEQSISGVAQGNDLEELVQTAAPEQSEESAYQDAVNLILKERDYDQAIPAFQSFLSRYPASSYTDNAHYWLGQLLFNKQRWDEAKQQFSEVVDKFANSPKRADSLLKLGMVAKSQSNLAQAKNLFEQVVSQYPDSAPARLAQQQLSGL